jgi:hypothetical protein
MQTQWKEEDEQETANNPRGSNWKEKKTKQVRKFPYYANLFVQHNSTSIFLFHFYSLLALFAAK